ncbi:MAG: ABC transporter ATP-binding protein [Syntrophobacteraceae bacterium]|nr:ABC transporter ATP-binding protein [Syntrophobacteraceae bacterium]
MLAVNNIEVVYSKVILVLRGVSLEVGEGKMVCLLGANGAGKSTALKSVSGLLGVELGEVIHGSIEFLGQRIEKRGPEEVASLGIRQVIEGRRLYAHLSVEENLLLGAYLNRDRQDVRRRLEQVYEYFPPLSQLKRRVSGYLSGGEQQMLVIGRSLMARPKIMLLDEPSLGLAPLVVHSIFEIMKKFNREEKIAVLLVEQNARAALSICEHAYIMENGRIVLDGPAAQIAENADVREFYLGLSGVGKKKSYREIKHYKRRKRWLG